MFGLPIADVAVVALAVIVAFLCWMVAFYFNASQRGAGQAAREATYGALIVLVFLLGLGWMALSNPH